MILPVTLSAAAAAAVLNLWLSIRVGQVRTARKISVGDGGDESVIRRMRAHSNYIENMPLVLILVLAVELARPGNIWLAGVAVVFIVLRVAHGLGMDGGSLRHGRMVGTIGTMLVQLVLAIWAISIALDA